MNLFEILEQLKKIEPDPAFKETSKRAIFALAPKTDAAEKAAILAPAGLRVRHTLLKIVETGAAVALTGLFVLIITGAFSGTALSPRYAAVDPGALRAEAQAIDIQIQLANLNYVTPSSQSTLQVSNNTSHTATNSSPVAVSPSETASSSPAGGANTTTTTVSIDQALQNLAQ